MDAEQTMTLDRLKGLIKEVAGETFAEIQKANEARGLEAIQKGVDARLEQIVNKVQGDRKVTHAPTEEKGLALARYARLYIAAGKDPVRMKAMAEEWQTQEPCEHGDRVVKLLSAGQPTQGAEFVIPQFVTEVIELLRPVSIVRALGARTVPLPQGTLTIPKQTASASFEWVGENTGQNASSPTTGNINLSAKMGRVTVPISNQLLRFASVDTDRFVRDDIVQAVRIGEDLAFLRSQGTQFKPKGLRYWAPSGNVVPMTATPDLAKVTADLGVLILKLEEANVGFVRPGWIFAPRTRHYLMTLRDANGNFAFRPEMLGGTLWGFPWRSSTSVPKNLGGASNESEVMLVDANDVLIGEAQSMQIDASTEASYKDAAGNLVSAFDLNQTVLRSIMMVDLGVRHEESIAVLTGVTWGA